jgi:putative DNA primase/helicase
MSSPNVEAFRAAAIQIQEHEDRQPKTNGASAARPILDRKDPLRSARTFVLVHYQHDGKRTLHYHRGDFYAWSGSHYAGTGDHEIRAQVYDFLDNAVCPAGEGATEPFKPSTTRVNDVIDALRAVAILPDREMAPCWLDGRTSPDPTALVACANGLLHLITRELHKPTPAFYGHHAVEFDYDPTAPAPTHWGSFLRDLWGDDQEAIDTLQEIFGYLLTADTRQQKVFLIVGPKRSGKGTIARIAKAMLGNANVAGPTLSGLGMNFGLAPLIGKPLAVISDARLSGRSDQHVIAERLLSISGEDTISIDRKHKTAWTGTLPTRFMILTNELPRIADASGALASRFVVLTMMKSFYGREDHGLTDRLMAELPGILNWSITGLERLRRRGHFVQPGSSEEAIAELEDLGSPIGAFIRERCTVAPGATVQCTALYDAWKAWGEAQGREHPGTVQTFGRDLRAAVAGLTVERPRSSDGQARVYSGIRLG